MDSDKVGNYLALLAIRRAAMRRDVTIIGGVFIVSFLSTITLGMLERLNGRSLYLVAGMVMVFGLAFLRAWARLEITKASIELISSI